MKTILLLNKPPGLTPLQAIELFKNNNSEYKNSTLSYAGRLDPMAEGLLLILVGDENTKRHDYEHLPKTYEFQILVGFATDTYDVMGMITNASAEQIDRNQFDDAINNLHGTQTFPYPPYSSKPVNGHPLYWYAKRNLLSTITIPTQDIEIQTLEKLHVEDIPTADILQSITERLTIVKGNFRQEEILKQWQQTLSNKQKTYQVIQCRLEATSGTYVRGIVHMLSNTLHIPLLTFSIKRISIGRYTLFS